MKTHIIQLQPNDDWQAAAGRLPRAAGNRAVLVWSDRQGPEPAEAALRRLIRWAAKRGLGLAVASARRNVVQAAESLGLPVFAEAQEAGRADWEPAGPTAESAADLRAQADARRQLRAPAKFPVRLAWFALGVLAFLLAASLLLGLRA